MWCLATYELTFGRIFVNLVNYLIDSRAAGLCTPLDGHVFKHLSSIAALRTGGEIVIIAALLALFVNTYFRISVCDVL